MITSWRRFVFNEQSDCAQSDFFFILEVSPILVLCIYIWKNQRIWINLHIEFKPYMNCSDQTFCLNGSAKNIDTET